MRKPAAVAALLFTFALYARGPETGSVGDAYRTHASHVTVTGSGTVVKLLRDDNEGARHQRFLITVDGLPSDRTVLVAHNIDLAPRVAPLRRGNRVEFRGEYIWNPKGGILHWTHHDPSGRHPAGWLKRDGRVFE
jgi:hypothetical protein